MRSCTVAAISAQDTFRVLDEAYVDLSVLLLLGNGSHAHLRLCQWPDLILFHKDATCIHASGVGM